MTENAEFTAALMDPTRPAPSGLSDPEGRPAVKRFDIYRNNVTASLTEALEQSFPVLQKVLGVEFFAALAREFIRAHPPQSPILSRYGDQMPAFLETFPPVAQLGYLPDVARLEQAIRESYHAADMAPADTGLLASMPADRLMAQKFTFAPTMRMLRSRWPIHDIWRANSEPGAPAPGNAPQAVLVTRPDYDPQVTLLGPGAPTFIASMIQGATLGMAHEEASSKAPAFDLSALLGQLFAGGAVTELNED
ncbi:MAG: HvfC/BufC N-terminal domain-containing protein [Brevirhabdus sp.]